MSRKNLLVIGVEENWEILENLRQLKPVGIDIHISSNKVWVEKLFPQLKFINITSDVNREFILKVIEYCKFHKIGWIIPFNSELACILNHHKKNMEEHDIFINTSYGINDRIFDTLIQVEGVEFTFSLHKLGNKTECEKVGIIDAYVDYHSGEVISCFFREEYERYENMILSWKVFSDSILVCFVEEIVQRLTVRGAFSMMYIQVSPKEYIITELNCFIKDSSRKAILNEHDFVSYLWSNIQGVVLLKEACIERDFVYRLDEEYFLF